MSHNSLEVQLHIPVLRAEADAHGLDHRLCQLIISAGADGKESSHEIAATLTNLLPQDLEVGLLVIGPFENVETTNQRLRTKPAAKIGGMSFYQLSGTASVTSSTLEIDAEELALFGYAHARLTEYIARVEAAEAKWWRLDSTTLRGALTKAPELVDPVALYSRSLASLELLGTRATIKRCAEAVWSLV